MTTMNESTPLVRARALDGDAEDAQTADQHAVDRTARRTRASVRAPITLALSWVFLLVVAATYYHSDGFDSVKRATRTVKGVRVFDDDGDRLQSARVCESASMRDVDRDGLRSMRPSMSVETRQSFVLG